MPEADQTPPVSTPDKVAAETKTRRRRRKRTRDATIQRRIHAQARERQVAWSEAGLPDVTEALTRKLTRDFAELRKTDRDAYAAGVPEGTPYRGRTWGPR